MSSSSLHLYLDVTSACQSTLNTGVKRMQRGLHHWLKQQQNYHATYWQSAQRDYRHLNEHDLNILELREPNAPQGLALYDTFLTSFFSDYLKTTRDQALRLKWPQQFQAEDILLVPDLLWDNRSTFFRKLRSCPAKLVGVFHDAIGLRRPEQSRIDHFLCGRGVRALASFDLVLCISREAEEDLHYFWKKMNLPQTRTHVAPWPVPFSSAQPEHQENFSAKQLLYVARLEEHKNHLRLLAACEQLWKEGQNFQLLLIGCNAYPLYSWKVQRQVRKLQDMGYAVSLKPHVSEAELHQAYRESSFTVFPSLLEGFGLPIIESLWHGRPVVCGGKGALGEVAAGGGSERVEPASIRDLARGIRLLLTDEAHYKTRYQEIQKRLFRSWNDYWQAVSGVIQTLDKK